eukprot:CAMPEP_0174888582 /NCGR_PEP_ID=MMETSP0167-20121228/3859_1 /TAXON_ID=38298 /ORGANISM="Rhodella maculata, Strain CCMP736" /LENGTH=118 /DNA_ID=CAMNT_0016125621 /DNA_START=343 /DNA_END=700 /DNA_ORIENTATION=-
MHARIWDLGSHPVENRVGAVRVPRSQHRQRGMKRQHGKRIHRMASLTFQIDGAAWAAEQYAIDTSSGKHSRLSDSACDGSVTPAAFFHRLFLPPLNPPSLFLNDLRIPRWPMTALRMC